MASGEIGFTTRGKTIKRVTYPPLPTKDYKCKLVMDHAEVDKAQAPGSLPYVNGVRLEVLDTAGESGKNRLVFARLFTGITPNKNGNSAFMGQSGPAALSKALGSELDVPADAIKKTPEYDGKEPTGNVVEYVDPKYLISFFKSMNGQLLDVHIRRTNPKDGEPRNEVAYYIGAEVVAGSNGATETDNSWNTADASRV